MDRRNRNLVVRMADDELGMMHAIAAAERETAATLVRRWVRQHHEARFGSAKPSGVARSARLAPAKE